MLKFLNISNNFFFFSYSLFSSSFLSFIFFLLINSTNSSFFLLFLFLAKGNSSELLFSVSLFGNWIVEYFLPISNKSDLLLLIFDLCLNESFIFIEVDKFLLICLLLLFDISIWNGNFFCSSCIFCKNSNWFTFGFKTLLFFFVTSKVNWLFSSLLFIKLLLK